MGIFMFQPLQKALDLFPGPGGIWTGQKKPDRVTFLALESRDFYKTNRGYGTAVASDVFDLDSLGVGSE
jgi:hypothetical protein